MARSSAARRACRAGNVGSARSADSGSGSSAAVRGPSHPRTSRSESRVASASISGRGAGKRTSSSPSSCARARRASASAAFVSRGASAQRLLLHAEPGQHHDMAHVDRAHAVRCRETEQGRQLREVALHQRHVELLAPEVTLAARGHDQAQTAQEVVEARVVDGWPRRSRAWRRRRRAARASRARTDARRELLVVSASIGDHLHFGNARARERREQSGKPFHIAARSRPKTGRASRAAGLRARGA
jgi:hypothetical protein